MPMYYVFGNHILSHLRSFSLFIPKSLEILYTCVSIQNINVHEVLGDSYR